MRNDPVPSGDVTIMRTATAKVGAALGVSLMAAAASIAVGPVTASAQPDGQQVRYTLTSAGAYEFDLFYLTSQPPSMEAFNADAYAFAKREKVNLAPGVPWVFETTMADPQWAILTVSSTTRGGQAAPNAHCDIAVDGQVLVAHDDPYNVRCQLSKW
ncbi:hypothetical protein GCM10027535_30110 [Mycolicibacterium hippocampi]|uniref:Uncharacterized protein n=2 Tax=Mycolicibacterium hippocampi TaxID=659824 RepID=A0A7I9ZP99_9MYCO|nr:hypothetical protein MHIP_33640 [Mycolicibacterium hippocampi]